MPSHRIRARPPVGAERLPPALTTPDATATYVRDAAATPGGHTRCVFLPRGEAEVAAVLKASPAVLPVGAQSSLTGGATPFGADVMSLARMDAIRGIGTDAVVVEAGVALSTLAAELAARGLRYPPVPTFDGALVGGVVATNAAGAETFKYGSTRAWVRALTVVLASGDVLDLARGECRARDGRFEIEDRSGAATTVPIPDYTMPPVAKRSAGYHAEPDMDLVDLFVGSEGTLGVVVQATLAVVSDRPRFHGLVLVDRETDALALAARLRAASQATWAAGDPAGVDVAAIEFLDRRCLELLRADGADRAHGITLAPRRAAALFLEMELPPGTSRDAAEAQLARADDPMADTPLARLVRLLEDSGCADGLELALPGDARRTRALAALREAVPLAVNARVAQAQRTRDPAVRKVAADMIVPFERLAEALAAYRAAFASRGLDHALWGHVSDGNVHANAIPATAADVHAGDEAILECGARVIEMGGCPLAEHGVGRNAVKQELLRQLYGARGIASMRRVKEALDPAGVLAPGVLFPA